MYQKALNLLAVMQLIILSALFCLREQSFLKNCFSMTEKIQEVEVVSSNVLTTKEEAHKSALKNNILNADNVQNATVAEDIVQADSLQIIDSENEILQEKWNDATNISISEDEYEVLCRIVEAEAGGEDTEGKLLVANVVLNRTFDNSFPNTISEVVFQKEKGVTQFSPISDGRFYEVKISEDTIGAVNRALEGEDNSEGALFFAARKYADPERMKWFDDNLEFLFCHGGHDFFK